MFTYLGLVVVLTTDGARFEYFNFVRFRWMQKMLMLTKPRCSLLRPTSERRIVRHYRSLSPSIYKFIYLSAILLGSQLLWIVAAGVVFLYNSILMCNLLSGRVSNCLNAMQRVSLVQTHVHWHKHTYATAQWSNGWKCSSSSTSSRSSKCRE